MRGLFPRNPGITLLVAGTLFMENLDSTIVVTSLPQMAASFGVEPVDVTVGIMAYMLTLAVFIPVSGWIADRIGVRTTFSIAIATFILGSILCSLSTNIVFYAFAEFVQGMGGAMMVPVGRLAVLRNTEKHDLTRAISAITWPALTAPILGPPLGGFITHYFSWHWIFLVNVPIGVVALIVALKLIPAGTTELARPFDWLGFVLTGSAGVSVIYAIDLLSRGQASTVHMFGAFAMAVAFVTGAIHHARAAKHPMLELWALRLPSYSIAVAWGSFYRISVGALPFLLPLLFQVSFGLNPLQSGTLLLAVFAGNFLTKFVTVPILHAFPYRTTMIANGTLNFVAILACAFLTRETPVFLIAALLFLSGVTRSMQFTAMSTLAFADVPQERMSGASSLASTAQQLTFGLGLALGAALLRIADQVQGNQPGTLSPTTFKIVFVVIAVISLVSALNAQRLPVDAGDNVRLRRK